MVPAHWPDTHDTCTAGSRQNVQPPGSGCDTSDATVALSVARTTSAWLMQRSITTQQSVAGSQQIQLQSSISSLQSLDYAGAITTLDQQNTTLSAALQAYTITQGLSLFKYL